MAQDPEVKGTNAPWLSNIQSEGSNMSLWVARKVGKEVSVDD